MSLEHLKIMYFTTFLVVSLAVSHTLSLVRVLHELFPVTVVYCNCCLFILKYESIYHSFSILQRKKKKTLTHKPEPRIKFRVLIIDIDVEKIIILYLVCCYTVSLDENMNGQVEDDQ